MSSSKRRGTAILGIKWVDENGIKVLIAADSQVTLGDTRYIDSDPQCKLVSFPHFVVGVGGVGPIQEVLLKMTSRAKFKKMKLQTIPQVQEFAKEVFKAFNALLSDALQTIDDSDTSPLMIITRDKLFQITTDMGVTSIDTLVANGCGGNFALGAAMVLYQQLKPGKVGWGDLHNIATRAIKVACLLSEGCAEPVRIAQVT